MNVLSLCSGIGGLDLGLKLAVPEARTICYVEIEPFCQEILLRRADDGWLDRAPIWPDLTAFDGRQWRGLVDCVIGGYPCQPFSSAGKRKGAEDPRHLWPHVARVVGECQPRFAFFENVAGHLSLGFQEVAEALEGMGYCVSAGLFTAAEVGAPHRRQRLFILAYSPDDLRWPGISGAEAGIRQEQEWWRGSPGDGAMDDPTGLRLDGRLPGSGAPPRDKAWRRELSGRCDAVADAEQPAVQQEATGRAGDSGGIATPRPGLRMGHPDEPRLEGRDESRRGDADELDAWPPGPSERDRWADVLARWPGLAPALGYPKRSRRDGGPPSEPGQRRTWRQSDAESQSSGDGLPVAPESPLRRVADGVAPRIHRLRALGNGVVPVVAALAWETLMRTDP